MSIAKSFLSGTQTLGKMNIYISTFVMFIVVIGLIALLYSIAKTPNKNWPQRCDPSKTQQSVNCVNLSKNQTMILLVFIILVLSGIGFFTFSFRNSKALQTMRGAGVEANFVKGLF